MFIKFVFCCYSRNNSEDKMTVIACYDETGNPYATKNERKGFCLLPWCYL